MGNKTTQSIEYYKNAVGTKHCAECGCRIEGKKYKALGIVPVCSKKCYSRVEERFSSRLMADVFPEEQAEVVVN